MPLSANAMPLDDRLPTLDEREGAATLKRVIEAADRNDPPGRLEVSRGDGETAVITLSPAISSLLLELLGHISEGNAVTLVPRKQQLTTQQAADILNVSRPYLIKLIERGDLECELVGWHRRIKAEDVFAYSTAMKQKAEAALDQMAEVDGDLI